MTRVSVNMVIQREVSRQPSDYYQCPSQVHFTCREEGEEGISQNANGDSNDKDAPHPDNETPEQSQ
jgi:hypothetical protein